MYIGVYGYGERRFELTFNPCSAEIDSACPLNEGVPIEAQGIIPMSDQDISVIPSTAYDIPDFEGEAVLRIFANSTQEEIGCFAAVVTNGNTFSQPQYVGSILGIFTFVAVVSSFATAIYGDHIPEMRKHYAHSLSVLVVFSSWQHIFYSGALSVNWPGVLVAFWSNYAWAGGMIYIEGMQNTINNFIGSNKGNTSAVGAAGTGEYNSNHAGEFDIQRIYRRHAATGISSVVDLINRSGVEHAIAKRELPDTTTGFPWYGSPVKPGLPLPGNYSGFAGALAWEQIPASNAFMTGFLWFLILIGAIAASVVIFKFLLEGLIKTKLVKNDRLVLFRSHYLGYTLLAVLRTLFIGFFAMMFLSMFQFTYLATPGPVAVACVVFLIMLVGIGGLAAYACFYRFKFGNCVSEPDRLNVEKKKLMKMIPWYRLSRASRYPRVEDRVYVGSVKWWRVGPLDGDGKSVHEDEDYTKKFGWLAGRFRRTRWWFFVVWLIYEFVRACFLAGASGNAMVQVFGLLTVEIIAFIGLIVLRPFEGQRLNVIVVYALGFSKVVTVALSAAFDTRFNLPRMSVTIIGIVIVAVHGILTAVVMVAILVGAASSYMSVMRNRETENFKPKRWRSTREKYFQHMDSKVLDIRPSPPPPPAVSESPKGPYFSVTSIKRLAKIEDEDAEFQSDIQGYPSGSQASLSLAQDPSRNRAPSIRSQVSHTSLPYGARVHRASWSSRDFNEFSASERRRSSRGNSMTFTGEEGFGANKSFPTHHSRTVGSSDSISYIPTPPPSNVQPQNGQGSRPSPQNRPKSRTSIGGVRSPRPQLQTLISENEIPKLPQTRNAREATNVGRAV